MKSQTYKVNRLKQYLSDDMAQHESPPKHHGHTRSFGGKDQTMNFHHHHDRPIDLGGGSIIYDAKTNLPLFKVNSVADWLEKRKSRQRQHDLRRQERSRVIRDQRIAELDRPADYYDEKSASVNKILG